MTRTTNSYASTWSGGDLDEIAAQAASVSAGGWLDVVHGGDVIGRVRWLLPTDQWEASSHAWPAVRRTRETHARAVALLQRMELCESYEEARRAR